MSNKQKVYIMNQGIFNMYGYQNLTLPAIVDLTLQQIEDLKAKGYVIQNFTGIAKPAVDRIVSVSCATLKNRRNG